LNQLIKDDDGQILLDGNDIRTANKTQLRKYRRQIGMVFQNYNLVYLRFLFYFPVTVLTKHCDTFNSNSEILDTCSKVSVLKMSEVYGSHSSHSLFYSGIHYS